MKESMKIKATAEATVTATCAFCGKTVVRKCDPRDLHLPLIPECFNDWSELCIEISQTEDEPSLECRYLVCPKCRTIARRAIMFVDAFTDNAEHEVKA